MNDQNNKAHLQAKDSEVEVVDTGTPEKDPRDAITEEHPRFKEVYDNLKTTKSALEDEKSKRERLEMEMEELRQMVTEANKPNGKEVYTEEEEAALDRILVGLKKKAGIITREDLESAQRTEKRAQTISNLEREYDGSNGLPRFETNEVVEYAQRNGFGDNLRAAYRDLHWSALVKHEARNAEVSAPGSEPPSGGRDRELQSDIEKVKEGDRRVWRKKKESIMEEFKKSIFNK